MKLDWTKFNALFKKMDKHFMKADPKKYPLGTVIHTKITAKFPDGRVVESESTMEVLDT